MRVHHIDSKVSDHLIEAAKNYNSDEFDRFAAEIGWEDWMHEFAPEEEWISESEGRFIDSILKEAFELAHTTEDR